MKSLYTSVNMEYVILLLLFWIAVYVVRGEVENSDNPKVTDNKPVAYDVNNNNQNEPISNSSTSTTIGVKHTHDVTLTTHKTLPSISQMPNNEQLLTTTKGFIDDHITKQTAVVNNEPMTGIAAVKELAERDLSDEERLMNFLLKQYNPSARPVLKGSKTVNVAMQFSLMHIKELDVKSQILTTTGLLILEWKDERLTWFPEEHNGLTEIIIEIEMLWKPEFAVINGAEDIYEEYNQFRAVVTNSGTVHWEPGGVFKTMCEIDITYYPFDDQKCNLKFGAWTYHTGKMNMTNLEDEVNQDSYNENGEWTIQTTQVKRGEFTYTVAPDEPFAFVDFVIYLRRRHTFYILNVILPSIMTSVLLLSVFFCTPAQKVQIGVVVLLSFRIFLLNVADNIPKTSDHIPLLGIYLTCTMAITTLSMVLTVFVLNLHHISDRPVPRWTRSILFTGIARIMGMCNTADALAKKSPNHRFHQTFMNNIFRRTSCTAEGDSIEEKAAMMLELQNKSPANVENADSSPTNHERNVSHGTKHDSYVRKLQLLKEEEKIKEQNKTEDYAKDWKKVAEIFDRLFFWLFLFAIVLSTLILFHPLTKKERFNTDSH